MTKWSQTYFNPLVWKDFYQSSKIDIDFATLHPNCNDFITKWSSIAQQILKYAESKCLIWKDVLGIRKETLVEADIRWIQAQTERKQLQDKYAKSIDQRIQELMSQISEVVTLFDAQVGQSLEEFLAGDNLPTQPFVFCFGDHSSFELSQSFAVIEHRCIPGHHFVKAVDLSFKMYFLLHIWFPTECRQVWNFLDECVYGIVREKTLISTGKGLKQYCDT